jgi:tight adherence protein C
VIVIAMHLRTGGDAAAMIESLAELMRRRTAWRGSATAAAAGMKLSGRVIACLPLLFVPAMPLTRSSLIDPPGVAMLVGGILLALAGLRSIERLIPSVPDEVEGSFLVASLLAMALRAGVGMRAALEVIATHGPPDVVEPLRRARRMTCLGCSWWRSLQLVEDARLAGIGWAVWRAESRGLPAADALEEWVRAAQEERAQEFEASVRRVPVLMVFPLTLFVLPSFFLLALGPFLRGLAEGW